MRSSELQNSSAVILRPLGVVKVPCSHGPWLARLLGDGARTDMCSIASTALEGERLPSDCCRCRTDLESISFGLPSSPSSSSAAPAASAAGAVAAGSASAALAASTAGAVASGSASGAAFTAAAVGWALGAPETSRPPSSSESLRLTLDDFSLAGTGTSAAAAASAGMAAFSAASSAAASASSAANSAGAAASSLLGSAAAAASPASTSPATEASPAVSSAAARSAAAPASSMAGSDRCSSAIGSFNSGSTGASSDIVSSVGCRACSGGRKTVAGRGGSTDGDVSS
mmetsp:Transcript_39898/g.118809  ORF Transcript_39898/g.118809 Transcript_39898/m.118809 type:complete len:286 (-) Transcript_39898:53-910(-)